MFPSSIQQANAYSYISMGTLSWNTQLEASILERIQVSLSLMLNIILLFFMQNFALFLMINFNFDCRPPNLSASPTSWQDLQY